MLRVISLHSYSPATAQKREQWGAYPFPSNDIITQTQAAYRVDLRCYRTKATMQHWGNMATCGLARKYTIAGLWSPQSDSLNSDETCMSLKQTPYENIFVTILYNMTCDDDLHSPVRERKYASFGTGCSQNRWKGAKSLTNAEICLNIGIK